MASDDDGLAGLEETARRRPRRRGRAILGFFALLIIAAFIAVIRIAYDEGIREGKDLAPPLVRAKDGPVKVTPEEPGGMKVPNQDKQVFATLEPDERTEGVEELLPPPEMPAPEAATESAATPPPPVPAADEAMVESPARSETAAAPPPIPPAPSETVDDRPPAPAPQGETATAATPTPVARRDQRLAAAQPTAPPENANTDAESAAPAAAPPRKATTLALAGAHRIQLGSFRTEKDAERAWGIFKERHPGELAQLAPMIVRAELAGGSQVYYRVQAGPFDSRTAATSVCSQLKAKKQGCLVVSP